MQNQDMSMVCNLVILFNILLSPIMTKKEKPIVRQRCEVYSRIVGYIRPVTQWNPGKQSEFQDRVTFIA